MTAHTHDLGGDALLQLVGAGRNGLHDHVVVAVGIHKAGGQGQTLGVDDRFGLFRDDRGDDGNFALPDAHVGIVGRHAGAVHDTGVFNQKIQHKSTLLRVKNLDFHHYNTVFGKEKAPERVLFSLCYKVYYQIHQIHDDLQPAGQIPQPALLGQVILQQQ